MTLHLLEPSARLQPQTHLTFTHVKYQCNNVTHIKGVGVGAGEVGERE